MKIALNTLLNRDLVKKIIPSCITFLKMSGYVKSFDETKHKLFIFENKQLL